MSKQTPMKRAADALAPLLIVGAWLGLSRWAGAVSALPVLGAIDGPLGIFFATLAVVLALAAMAPRGMTSVPLTASTPMLIAVAFGFLATVGLAYTSRLRVSGDEPHYLVMAQSLWREGDLDLRDNYERGDWLEYTAGPLSPHYGTPRADGRPFPAHSPGLALLLAPVYAAGGRPACVLALCLLGALLSVELRAWALRLTGDGAAGLFAWALALTPPLAFYAFHVYTELPSALALAAALRLLLSSPGPAGAVVAALLASALPWLHVKMVPPAAVLGLVAVLTLHGRARAAFVTTAAVMAAAYLLYYRAIFGVASPLALYGGLPAGESASPLRGAAGLLLDRSFGLLPHAPVFVLALAGMPALARRRGWPVLACALAVVAPVVGWRMWWGGQCPPARFLVPAAVALAVAAALRTVDPRRGLARWRWPLVLVGVALTVGMTAHPGALLLLNRGDRPTRLWAALSGEVPIGRYLPSLVVPDASDWRVTAIWLAALALLIALDRLARTRDRVDRLFRGLTLPLVMLLAVGLAVDLWARPPSSTASTATSAARRACPGAGRA